jgi:putative ABC transport system permease protein
VLGLTIGITASILIFFWVLDEFSYDNYFDKADRIHRIDLYSFVPQTRTPYPMAYGLVRDFPEVINATSLSPIFGPNMSRPTFAVEHQNIRFDEKNIYGADTNFFDIFSFEFIMGDPNTAFQVPNAVIITRDISEKYFGQKNPIGKFLTINEEVEFIVTGVLENLPSNIHFHFDFLVSYTILKRVSRSEWFSWSDPGHYNYVLTVQGADIRELQEKIPEWIIQYLDQEEDYHEDNLAENLRFQLTPIRDIHLKSNIRWELETNGNLSYVYIFIVTSLLILIVACINYMNLATARFSKRAGEVAVRKTVGASRSVLIYQFLLESFLQTFIAVILSVFLVELLMSTFSSLTGKDYSFYYSQTGLLLIALVLFLFIVSLIAGSYPALYLSSFQPIKVFKKQHLSLGSVTTIRIVLVVFQFTVSIFLIIGTLTIFRQLKYLHNKDLGFDMENVVVIPVKDDRIRSQIEQIKESLLQYPGVVSVSAVSNIPSGRINNNQLGNDDGSVVIEASEVSVDYDYIETINLNLVEGRNFSRKFRLDSISRFILNEQAIRELEMTDPVNQRVTWYDDDSTYRGEIIGIVEDFHFRSLHEDITPLIIMVKPSDYSYLMVRLAPDRIPRLITEIKSEWQKFDDLFTFEYSFLSDESDKQYMNEERMGTIYWMLAVLAVIIASFGLYGLSTFTVEQKTQEIGIRKVHGASIPGILTKLLIDFCKWVILAFLIASPLAFWGMSYWLRDFSYQVKPSIWIFLAAYLITEVIAVMAVSYQSLRASRLKPVDSLRYE